MKTASSKTPENAEIAAVRAFNRSWTQALGVLDDGLLDTPHSLPEARVLFELAQPGAIDLTGLRARLDLDAGYLTRIVQRLVVQKLVESRVPPEDRRRRILSLTARGRRAFADLDARSSRQAAELLGRFTGPERRNFVEAAAMLGRLLQPPLGGTNSFVIRPLRAGDLGWVVERHGTLYEREYGWDQRFEALVAQIVADYGKEHDPKKENAWIAERDGVPVGCVFCVRKDSKTAQLRILLVDPVARGLGIGGRLVEECLRFAERAGYGRIVLWTNDVLDSARKIYQAAGFVLVEEEKHESFGKNLVGQMWALDLPRG